jgi:6-phosphogluconolactonase
VFAPCLGANTIALFDLNPKTGQLSAKSPAQLNLTIGGPRHMAFHPNGAWAYVLKELDSTIQAPQFNSQIQALQLLGAPISTRMVQKGSNSAAEIQMHPSGSYVYSSNRGDDTIAVFTVGSNGSLQLSSSISSGGATPRHFSIYPTGQWLLVAHQNSDSIKVFKIDRETGRLSPTDQSLAFGAAQFIQVLNLSDIRR